MTLPETLRDVVNDLNVVFAAIANLQSGEIHWIGDSALLGNTDLSATFFADRETVESLNSSLEGQILPRLWSQGRVSCTICKPTDQIIVGLFVAHERDAGQQYLWSIRAAEAIRLSFAVATP